MFRIMRPGFFYYFYSGGVRGSKDVNISYVALALTPRQQYVRPQERMKSTIFVNA